MSGFIEKINGLLNENIRLYSIIGFLSTNYKTITIKVIKWILKKQYVTEPEYMKCPIPTEPEVTLNSI